MFNLTLPKNFVGVTRVFQKFQKYSAIEKFYEEKRGREVVSQNSVGNLLSHSAEKHRGGTLLCFWKFLVSKNFIDKRRGRGYHDFEPGGGVARFSLDYLMSHSTETFVREPFSASLISGIKKTYAQEGYISIFREKVWSHSAEKHRGGTLLCFRKFGVSKKITHNRGVLRFCIGNF